MRWRDAIGQRGESIFYVIITRLYGRSGPLFRPQFLGDKWPTVDFIVELTNCPGRITPYFFAQVKTTSQGYTQKRRRLKVKVSKADAERFSSYPAPTYIIGIDEIEEVGYIISVEGEHDSGLSSLSTQFPIGEEVQDLLWREVTDFWMGVDTSGKTSRFVDSDWR
ncbi:DUF4365 domain-containing protein [Candidatus Poribacteria bacterium]|nr:DUF4365 domain-containing protein [Candidatus Poribacteria bacterium]